MVWKRDCQTEVHRFLLEWCSQMAMNEKEKREFLINQPNQCSQIWRQMVEEEEKKLPTECWKCVEEYLN